MYDIYRLKTLSFNFICTVSVFLQCLYILENNKTLLTTEVMLQLV